MTEKEIKSVIKNGEFILNLKADNNGYHELHSAVQHNGSCNLDKIDKYEIISPEFANKIFKAMREYENTVQATIEDKKYIVDGCGHCTKYNHG